MPSGPATVSTALRRSGHPAQPPGILLLCARPVGPRGNEWPTPSLWRGGRLHRPRRGRRGGRRPGADRAQCCRRPDGRRLPLVAPRLSGTGPPHHARLLHDQPDPHAGAASSPTPACSPSPPSPPPAAQGVAAGSRRGRSRITALDYRSEAAGDVSFAIAIAVVAWALGEASRNRRQAIAESARRAVSEEQGRIARELHDVLAHNITVIVVQAAAADDVFDSHPDQARAALQSIEASARGALADLRGVLHGVRNEERALDATRSTSSPNPCARPASPSRYTTRDRSWHLPEQP